MISSAKEVNQHYTQIDLSVKLLTALVNAGKDINKLTREDIAAFDEFHIRGREATIEVGQLANLQPGAELLDLGCGIGGAARTIHSEFGCKVTGLDLVEEYIQAARLLNYRIGLNGEIVFEQGNALDTTFEDDSFNVVFSQHVTMNIADKAQLAEEVKRVLRPGGQFVMYEICAGSNTPPHFPVPWAGVQAISFLETPEDLSKIFEDAGFKMIKFRDVTAPSLKWSQEMVARMSKRPADAPPGLGLNLLMGPTTGTKVKNMMHNLEEDRIRVIQCVMELT
jgi:ubiquinone/menaquinone biosynthesis C-methylase UbiE